MRISWRTEWIHWAMLAVMFALAAWAWGVAPERLPVHFGFDGRPDRWGGRFEGLFSMPLIASALYLVLLVVPRLDPGRANYASFRGPYLWIRGSAVALLAVLQVLIALSAAGRGVRMESAVPMLVGGLMLVLGGVLGKVRPNWFVGIRTPWTLSSKVAWTRTHRAGGWLFLATGALFIVNGFAHARWLFVATIGLILVGSLALTVWSYLLWRGDPDKTPPAGTLPADEPRA